MQHFKAWSYVVEMITDGVGGTITSAIVVVVKVEVIGVIERKSKQKGEAEFSRRVATTWVTDASEQNPAKLGFIHFVNVNTLTFLKCMRSRDRQRCKE